MPQEGHVAQRRQELVPCQPLLEDVLTSPARQAASISALAVSAAVPTVASAQAVELDELIITATRRNSTVQDAPINIAAVGASEIEEQGLGDLAEVARWVPGVHIVDQGSRGDNRIIVRGLNADPLGSAEGVNNNGGGTVATYVGEIPLYVDLKTNDLERVEILLGPQGTLYGAGTRARGGVQITSLHFAL